MSENLSASPGQFINRIAKLNARWLEPRLQKLGLAVAQIPVFGAIRQFGPLSQKELAKRLYVEQPTMAQLLHRMERDGLIKRTPDLQDARSSLVHLTPRALKKALPARELLRTGRDIALEGLSVEEIATLNRILQKVLQNLENAIDSST